MHLPLHVPGVELSTHHWGKGWFSNTLFSLFVGNVYLWCNQIFTKLPQLCLITWLTGVDRAQPQFRLAHLSWQLKLTSGQEGIMSDLPGMQVVNLNLLITKNWKNFKWWNDTKLLQLFNILNSMHNSCALVSTIGKLLSRFQCLLVKF